VLFEPTTRKVKMKSQSERKKYRNQVQLWEEKSLNDLTERYNPLPTIYLTGGQEWTLELRRWSGEAGRARCHLDKHGHTIF
jgi:hypothetical protein